MNKLFSLCMGLVWSWSGCHGNRSGDPHVDQLVKPGQEKVLKPLLVGTDVDMLKDLVVFGDSLSDTGRLHSRSFGLYIPPEVYWKGRLTNGPNWTDYVCGAFDCKAYNYAVAGAATRLDSIPLRWIVRPLDAQVNEFLSEAPALTAGKTAAVIWIGANNYLHSKAMRADQARAEILTSATDLLNGPIDKLLIGTMPQLAGILKAPDATDDTPKEAYRLVTAEHNKNIVGIIADLQARFPKKTVALFDAYEINQATMDRPGDFGFTSLTEACYKGNYRGQFHGEHAFCPDYLGFKFWEYTHPNSRMHCYYAARFLMSLHEAGWVQTMDSEQALDICRKL